MKNILYLLIITAFLCSCMNPFNSRDKYYYANKKQYYSDIDMPSYSPDDTADPFNSKEDWNRIDYKFNGNELYNYFMKISFDVHTVPIYSFFIPNDGREWKKNSSSDYDEYTFDASEDGNTTESPIISGAIKISPMTVHRYGKNPLVSSDGFYNSSERIDRFFFIRAEGNAIVELDNYLIAIDTYSKFIFAYAKITKYVNISKNYFNSINRDVEIIKLNGSIELAPILNLSDVIVDIVETGSTLRENNLTVIKEIIDYISARLIVNKVSYKFKNDLIKTIVKNIEEVL